MTRNSKSRSSYSRSKVGAEQTQEKHECQQLLMHMITNPTNPRPERHKPGGNKKEKKNAKKFNTLQKSESQKPRNKK